MENRPPLIKSQVAVKVIMPLLYSRVSLRLQLLELLAKRACGARTAWGSAARGSRLPPPPAEAEKVR